MTARAWRVAAGALMVLGIASIARGGWICMKASVAQTLIGVAWQRTQAGITDAKPWPWADTRPVARLVTSSAARPLVVLEGASGRNLAFGPAHDSASVLPGARGNSVIEGHRDTHFRFLRSLKLGEALQVELPDGRSIAYTVSEIRVVDSRRWRIALDNGTPRLTLVTCYPFDAVVPGGPLRFVVTADYVPPFRTAQLQRAE
jgi:sortase A